MARGNKVSLADEVIGQGQKVVGSATSVQLTALDLPCSRVWVGAPSANHTKGSANAGNILIGKNASGGQAGGGMTLELTNLVGFFIPVDNANKVYLDGFNAGDAVEWQAFG